MTGNLDVDLKYLIWNKILKYWWSLTTIMTMRGIQHMTKRFG